MDSTWRQLSLCVICFLSACFAEWDSERPLTQEIATVHSRLERETIGFLDRVNGISGLHSDVYNHWHSYATHLKGRREEFNLTEIAKVSTLKSCSLSATWDFFTWRSENFLACGNAKGFKVYKYINQSIFELSAYDVGEVFAITHLTYGKFYIIVGTKVNKKLRVQWGELDIHGMISNMVHFDYDEEFIGIEALSQPNPMLLLVQHQQDENTYFQKFTIYRGEHYNNTLYFKGYDSVPIKLATKMNFFSVDAVAHVVVVEKRSVVIWQHNKNCHVSMQHFKIVQIIYVLDCLDSAFIKIGQKKFLILATSRYTYVYQWDGYIFSLHQTISMGSSSITTGNMDSCYNSATIILINESKNLTSQISFHLYDDISEMFIKTSGCPFNPTSNFTCNMESYNLIGKPLIIPGQEKLLMLPLKSEILIFEMHFVKYEVKDPIHDRTSSVSDESSKMKIFYSEIMNKTTAIEETLLLMESHVYDNFSVLGNLTTERNLESPLMTLIGSNDFNLLKLDQLSALENEIDQILVKMENISKRTLPSYAYEMLSLHDIVDLHKISTHHLSLVTIKETDIDTILEKSITNTISNYVVKGDLSLHDLSLTSINNISASQLISNHEIEDICGHKKFNTSTAMEKIIVQNLFGGINISNVLTLGGDLSLIGIFFQESISVDKLELNGLIDTVDWHDLTTKSLLKSVPQKLSGQKTLSADLFCDTFTVTGVINGIQMQSFHEIARIDLSQKFLYPITVKGDIAFENVEVLNKLNDVRIPEEIFGTHFMTIWSRKTFLSVAVDVLDVSVICDIPSNSYVTLDGNIHLNEIQFKNRVILNFTKSENDSKPLEKNNVFNGPVFFKSGLKVKSVNEVNPTYLLNNIAQKNDTSIVFTGVKLIQSLAADILNTQGYMGGLSLPDLVRCDAASSFQGSIIFKDTLKFKNITAYGKLDGCSVTALAGETVRLSAHQEILETLYFNNVYIDKLKVNGQFNGNRLSGIVTKNAPAVYSNLLIGTKVTTSHCILNNITLQSGKLLGFDLSLHERVVSLSSKQNLVGHITIDRIHVVGDLQVEKINGLTKKSIADIIDTLGTYRVDLIDHLSVAGSIWSEKGISGLKLSEVDGILTSSQAIIPNVMHFKNIVFSKIDIHEICGVDLYNLVSDSVMLLNHNDLEGFKYFTSPFQAYQIVPYFLNGVQRDLEAPIQSINNNIPRLDNLHVKGNLTYFGNLGTVMVEELIRKMDYAKFKIISEGTYNIGALNLLNLEVTDELGNYEFFKSAITLDSREFYYSLPIKCSHIITSYLEVAVVNENFVDDFISDLVLKNENSLITGSKVFSDVAFENVICFDEFLSVGFISGIDFDKMAQAAIVLRGNLQNAIFVMDNVEVAEDLTIQSLNKIPFHDYILLNEPQELTVPIYVHDAFCLAEVSVFSVNRNYLPVIHAMTVQKNIHQTIPGKISIESLFIVKGNLFTAAFSGNSTNIVSLNRPGEIFAVSKFISATFDKLLIMGAVNFPGKMDSLLSSNGSSVIQSTMVFNEIGCLGSILGGFSVNGVNLSNFGAEVNLMEERVVAALDTFLHETRENCYKFQSVSSRLQKTPDSFDYFSLETRYYTDFPITMGHSFSYMGKIYIICSLKKQSCPETLLLTYPPDSLENLELGSGNIWNGINYFSSYILVSISTQSNCSMADTVDIYLLDHRNGSIVQTINIYAKESKLILCQSIPYLVLASSDTLIVLQWNASRKKFSWISDNIPYNDFFDVTLVSDLLIFTATSMGLEIYSKDGQRLNLWSDFNFSYFKLFGADNRTFIATVEMEDAKIYNEVETIKVFSVIVANDSLSKNLYQVLHTKDLSKIMYLEASNGHDGNLLFLVSNCDGITVFKFSGASGFEPFVILSPALLLGADVGFYNLPKISSGFIVTYSTHTVDLYLPNTFVTTEPILLNCSYLMTAPTLVNHSIPKVTPSDDALDSLLPVNTSLSASELKSQILQVLDSLQGRIAKFYQFVLKRYLRLYLKSEMNPGSMEKVLSVLIKVAA